VGGGGGGGVIFFFLYGVRFVGPKVKTETKKKILSLLNSAQLPSFRPPSPALVFFFRLFSSLDF
jgi:hypothetical protein